jgi:hypothetical protein
MAGAPPAMTIGAETYKPRHKSRPISASLSKRGKIERLCIERSQLAAPS